MCCLFIDGKYEKRIAEEEGFLVGNSEYIKGYIGFILVYKLCSEFF